MQKTVIKTFLNSAMLFFLLLLNSCTVQVEEEIVTNDIKQAVDSTDRTNNFYDNELVYDLVVSPLRVEGEVANPGAVDFAGLPLHSVIVKETLLSEEGDSFVGAYRYDGYSLFDILNERILRKANAEEFNPIIDLYVEVENEAGEKACLSWGEIYYPNHLHEILIATRVMRIVPSKTKDLWTLPERSKLVVGTDLITERNISSPVRISVYSYPRSFETVKGLKPLYSPDLKIYVDDVTVATLDENPSDLKVMDYQTIFYGRGRGIHSTQPFSGVMLKEILGRHVPFTRESLMNGIFLVVAKDGYRSVFTFSEVMNRNDQSEVLLICHPEVTDNGIFRLFPAGDFFSDRAVKGITDIYYFGQHK